MTHRLSALALISFLGLLATGCGGGGGDDGDDGFPRDDGFQIPNAAVGGWWLGTTVIADQGTYELIGIVAENGRAYFLQEDGIMYWGTVRSSGNQVTGTFSGAGIMGTEFWDGALSGTGSLSGTVQARALLSGTSVFTTTLNNSSNSAFSLGYQQIYDDDSSLELIAGNYVDVLGLYAGVLNIASNGDVFLQDPISGCVVNGRIAIINSAYNAYDVRLTYSSCTGTEAVMNGATFTGLGSYDDGYGQLIALVQGTVSGSPYPNAFVFERL
jgi:hypothetical protein